MRWQCNAIRNLCYKNEEKSLVYDKIAEWAASIVQNNVAHVIFLTSDSSFSKPLSRAMPDRVFRTLSLGDLDPEVAKNFVISRLDEESHPDDSKDEGGNQKANQPPRLNLNGQAWRGAVNLE